MVSEPSTTSASKANASNAKASKASAGQNFKGPKGPKVKLEARVQLVHMDILATPEQLGPPEQPAQKEVLVKLATQVQLEILAPKGRKVLRAQRVRKVRRVILVCKVQLVLKAQLDQLVCKETPAILD